MIEIGGASERGFDYFVCYFMHHVYFSCIFVRYLVCEILFYGCET